MSKRNFVIKIYQNFVNQINQIRIRNNKRTGIIFVQQLVLTYWKLNLFAAISVRHEIQHYTKMKFNSNPIDLIGI